MARDHGRVLASIWSDRDFLALNQESQRFYMFLLSQPNLNQAGVLPVTTRRWSSSAADLTAAAVTDLLGILDRARFVVWDGETEEVLIRTFVRNDKVYRQPNVMQAMVADAAEIVSPRLRLALLAELDRLPLDEVKGEPTKSGGKSARATAEECIETLRRTLFVPEPTPDPDHRETLPGRVPGTLPETRTETPATRDAGRDAASHQDALTGFVTASWENQQVTDPQGTLPGTLPEWVPETPYAGARAPSPTPGPFPLPFPPPAGGEPPATGRTLELVHSAPAQPVGEPRTTEELVADWIDHCPKRPPGTVIGRVGKLIKQMLAEDIDPADIRAGIAAWTRKGKDPSVLPSIVNEVMNAQPAAATSSRTSDADLGGDAHMSRYLARAAARKARGA